MSDYTKTVDFAAKDALASGNAAKAAKGTEVDTEYNNIATAIASKYDDTDRNVADKIAGLDSSALVLPVHLPAATESAQGVLEIATQAEVDALTEIDKIVVPSTLSGGVQNFNQTNLALLDNIHTYTDPAADFLWGWDDSATNLANFALGTGLAFNATPGIELDHLGIEDLTDPGADRILFWDDGGTATGWLTATNGLEINTTNLRLVDVAAGATDPIDISSGAISFVSSSLTNLTISGTAADDHLIIWDTGASAPKAIDIQDLGVRVVNFTAAQTFAADDANTMQLLTGASNITADIPTNAAVGYSVGAVILLGARDTGNLTISPNTSAVRLTSVLRSDVGPSAGDHTILAGGTAMIIKVATNEWMIVGDIS